MEIGYPLCPVRVLLSLQVWVKVAGTAVSPEGFPEGALLFIRVYNKIAGGSIGNVMMAQKSHWSYQTRVVSKLCSRQVSFSNPELFWGVVRSKEGDPLKFYTHQVDTPVSLMDFII